MKISKTKRADAPFSFSSLFSCFSPTTVGKYQPNVILHAFACVGCPSGRWYFIDDQQDEANHDSLDDCFQCPAGYEFTSNTTECTVCRAGRYQDSSTSDNLECKKCPAGRFLVDDQQDKANHNSLDDCVQCPKGYEFTSPTTDCTVCRAGRYQDSATTDNVECKKCPAGTSIVNNGNTSKDAELFHSTKDNCLPCPDGTDSSPNADGCIVLDASKVPVPTKVSVHRHNDNALNISWQWNDGEVPTEPTTTVTIELSKERLFPDDDKITFKHPGQPAQRTEFLVSNLMEEVWKKVYYVRVRGVNGRTEGNPSAMTEKWTVANDCNYAEFLNEMSNDPSDWKCQQCPLGAYCVGEETRWQNMAPKFGYAACPVNATDRKLAARFAACPFQGACLGGPNANLFKKFVGEDGSGENGSFLFRANNFFGCWC